MDNKVKAEQPEAEAQPCTPRRRRLSACDSANYQWRGIPNCPSPDEPLSDAAYGVNPSPDTQVMMDVSGNGVADSVVDQSTGKPQLIPLPNHWSLHSLAIMVNTCGKAVSNASLSVKCKMAHKLATDCMDAGDICLFVPHGEVCHSKKYDQGTAELNTIEAFKEREGLRGHSEIVDVLHEWWGHVIGCKSEGAYHGYMTKAQYMESGLVVMHHMCPDEPHADVVAAVEEDWVADAKGSDRMNFSQFFDCMFELADMWCDSIDGHDYAEFLRGIFKEVSENQPRGTSVVGTAGMWHATKFVMAMPTTLYKAGGYSVNNFQERERVARRSVKEIMELVDKFNSNGKITVTEMTSFLDQSAFSGFSKWMTRFNRRNWMRFDVDKDGRIGSTELYNAMMAFIVSDSYGREFDRVSNDSGAFRSSPKAPVTPGPTFKDNDSLALDTYNTTKTEFQGDLPSSWLQIRSICQTIDTINFAFKRQASKKTFHFMSCSNMLTSEQEAEAKALFEQYDKSREGTLRKSELFMLMGMLNLKLKPKVLIAKVEAEFDAADMDGDGELDFPEFKAIYNKLVCDELTGDDNMDQYLG